MWALVLLPCVLLLRPAVPCVLRQHPAAGYHPQPLPAPHPVEGVFQGFQSPHPGISMPFPPLPAPHPVEGVFQGFQWPHPGISMPFPPLPAPHPVEGVFQGFQWPHPGISMPFLPLPAPHPVEGVFQGFQWPHPGISMPFPLHYAVLIPAEVHFPHTERVCIHLSNLNDIAQLKVTLQLQGVKLSLLEEKVQPPKLFKCVTFQVPPPAGGLEEVGQVMVTIQVKTLSLVNSKKVLVKSIKNGTFVQTDKAIYKPGQKVKFRIVTLNEDFLPDHSPYPLVELQDPNSNRIGQWLDMSPRQGIVDLSFTLSSEPAQGMYTIKVGDAARHQFTVEEYVMPKFEVLIQIPQVITILEKSFEVKVCARYTYGKPVQGQFIASLCRRVLRYRWFSVPQEHAADLCVMLSGKLERTGCFSKKIETHFINITTHLLMMSLEVEASVTEDGTDVTLSGTKSCAISSDIATVTFEDADEYYKAGIPYNGTMKLSSADGSPLRNETLYLSIHSGPEHPHPQNIPYVTDDSGRVSFSLETGDWASSVSLRGEFKLEHLPWETYDKVLPYSRNAHHLVKRFYSKSKSFLEVRSMQGLLSCGQMQDLQVDFIIQRMELLEDAQHVDLQYLVVSKGGLIHHGTKQLPVGQEAVLQGTFSIQIPVSAQLAPSAKVLVYTVFPDGEVAADTATFQISKCFTNQVTLGFSQEEALPGADVTLQLQSAPGSLCAVRAVDKSMVLMKPEEELTGQKVYNLIRPAHFWGSPYQSEDYEPNPCLSNHGLSRGRMSNVMPGWHPSEADVYSLLKDMGLKMITNTIIRKPINCQDFPRLMIPFGSALSPGVIGLGGVAAGGIGHAPQAGRPANNVLPEPAAKVEQQVRTFFPETWIWDLTPVGESGTTSVALTVPDTITEWVAGTFCIADVGFGISVPATLRAFKPFFVELSLPYSVVRDESFVLKATVFNYLRECIKVQMSLAKSEEFHLEARPDAEYTSCLCADEGKTFYWTVTAVKLGEVNLTVTTEALDTKEVCGNEITMAPPQGRIDTLIKPILVKAGGVLEEKAHSSLICAEGDSNLSDVISLTVPENILIDSERAHMSVLGDIMGTALQNIDQLLAMPSGCGEQNMVKLAPNIYILQYLEKTSQLTGEIKDKATDYLKTGYQRELNYKHDDGSYSAFGKRDMEGNTWLTAFVVKSFGQARPFIFVDEKHIGDAVRWLQKQQVESGCFRSVGKLLHSAMKGGVDDNISLSAYVTAALLELGTPLNDSTIDRALLCLKAALPNVTSVYTQALMAYTFTIAGDETARDQMMKALDQQAVKSVGQLHWQREDRPKPKDESYWPQAPSAEVEMTAYVLQAILSRAEGNKANIGRASQIVSWLTKQQNPYGGFSSTQDTVVALQSLAKYATATYSEKGDVTVTVKSRTGFHQEFKVGNKNRLLLQQVALSEIPGEYTVSAAGKGCVYIQTTLRYNIPPPKSDATFKLEVSTGPEACTEAARSKFSITVTASYTGGRTVSNMALIEVSMLSGFIPVKSSVRELEKKLVKKVEIKPDQVTIYLDELGQTPEQYTFSVEKDNEVKNLKPGTVIVYDYYEKDEHALAEYNAPCSAEDESKTENI